MKRQIVPRKMIVSVCVAVLFAYSLTAISYGQSASFSEDSTTRAIAENAPLGTNISVCVLDTTGSTYRLYS